LTALDRSDSEVLKLYPHVTHRVHDRARLLMLLPDLTRAPVPQTEVAKTREGGMMVARFAVRQVLPSSRERP
jgi:hypothetical protein